MKPTTVILFLYIRPARSFINSKIFVKKIDMNDDEKIEWSESGLIKCESTFSILDANGDGSISTQELQHVLRSLSEDPTLEDCKNITKDVDKFKKIMLCGSATINHLLRRNHSKNNQEIKD
ncbi:hypothetical protein MKW92_051471 [Papaver armeniacum]|nr:hypothetical protein MKW92_051471 [Papaver armeniacum]